MAGTPKEACQWEHFLIDVIFTSEFSEKVPPSTDQAMPSTRVFHSLEILESRIAPASLTFTDVDGEIVTIETSKGSIAELTTAAKLSESGLGMHLDELDLKAAVFVGTNLTITAAVGGVGDDKVNVVFLNALGRDLGSVTIGGGLDRINAGDAKSSTAAVKSLTVGGFGGGTALDSDVVGAITTLTVNGDFSGAFLRVRGSDSDGPDPTKIRTDRDGKIGTLTINGSVLGTARNDGGHIEATGDIGTIVVTGSIKGFIDPMTGGTPAANQKFNGRIFSGGKITSLTIGTDAVPGGIIGGDGEMSGQVASGGGIITATIKGSVTGGAGLESGAVGAGGVLKTVMVTGNLQGGVGESSGTLLSASSITTAKIGGNIAGGQGKLSGAIGTGKSIGNVEVTGDIVGGAGPSSGQIVSKGTIQDLTVRNLIGGSNFEAGSIGSLKGLGAIHILGNIVAGSGMRSGVIATEEQPSLSPGGPGLPPANAPIKSVTIDGSILGNPGSPSISGALSASIISSGQLGPVVIAGSVEGGDMGQSGRISSSKGITSVSIGGRLLGGDGVDSGSIFAKGAIGPVTIGANKTPNLGSIIGGLGAGSGSIYSLEKIARIDVFGSLLGGDGERSGWINADDLGAVFIAESVIGSFGSVAAVESGSIHSAGKIASVTIGDPGSSDPRNGSLIGGIAPRSGWIDSRGDLGPVKVKVDVQGGSGDNSGRITTLGKLASLSIGTDKIAGSLIGGAGNQTSSTDLIQADGQIYAAGAIGAVTITGSVQGGTLSVPSPIPPFAEAGASASGGGDFGGLIHGQSIASVVIGGGISGGAGLKSGGILADRDLGTVTVANVAGGSGSQSGFIAAGNNIKSVKIKNALNGGQASDSAFVAAGGTLNVFEAGRLVGGVGASRPRVSAEDAINTITISGSISDADILAGYTIDGVPSNPDAKIGKVVVGSSAPSLDGQQPSTVFGLNIVAGIFAGPDSYFGTSDDIAIISEKKTPVVSKIASVIVNGSIIPGGVLSSYGIVAQNVVAVKVGATSQALKAGALNDNYTQFDPSVSLYIGEKPVLIF